MPQRQGLYTRQAIHQRHHTALQRAAGAHQFLQHGEMVGAGHHIHLRRVAGLLPGVGRAVVLREGRVQEAVVRLADVPRVEGWAFMNSLRGWLAAAVG